MKKILIVFTDTHLAYSPSVLNLYDLLSNSYDVSILAFTPNPNYYSQKIINKKIIYIQHLKDPGLSIFRKVIGKTIKKIGIKGDNILLSTKDALTLIKVIKKFDGEIIAVDFFALWCVQKAKKKAHLFSLEISDNNMFKDSCSINNIKSLIIQSEERFKYLFGNQKIKTFFVQNSPIYIDERIDPNKRKKNELIFCGSAMPGFGIFNCIEFINDFSEYRLTIKGAVPLNIQNIIKENFSDLLKQNRLVINNEYSTPAELNSYLNNFRIGFVFYDNLRFDYINTFNYKNAPSGKLFQYYNAGLPVISNNLPGLYSIKEYNTGVIVKSMGSVAIKNAIDQIELDYGNYAIRSKNVSAKFDFRKNIAAFINYLDGPSF